MSILNDFLNNMKESRTCHRQANVLDFILHGGHSPEQLLEMVEKTDLDQLSFSEMLTAFSAFNTLDGSPSWSKDVMRQLLPDMAPSCVLPMKEFRERCIENVTKRESADKAHRLFDGFQINE